MARLNSNIESDDEFPDVSTLLSDRSGNSRRVLSGVGHNEDCKPTEATTTGQRRQRPLKLTHVNSLLLPLTNDLRRKTSDGSSDLQISEPYREQFRIKSRESSLTEQSPTCSAERSSPRKAVKRSFAKGALLAHRTSPYSSDEESSFEDNLSSFIVHDSASDIEVHPPRSQRKKEASCRRPNARARKSTSGHSVVDLISPVKSFTKAYCPGTPPLGPNKDPFEDDNLGRLRFSPPRSRSPHKRKDSERLSTPPNSPLKPDLQSPSKHLHRIPPSPHRPSIDAFWSQEVINDWNDQHSPRKPKSPQKLFAVRENVDEPYLSPSASPRKRSPIKSPGKRDKVAIERKKSFDGKKVQLAVDFLKELDEKVAQSRVGALAESAGGIKVIWSKKLNSTAGRANWKRETIVSKGADGGIGIKSYRHHASIELAEKVIDDEERLVNVLAHEYCHLANFMISGVKNNPHGKDFKEWAAKTTHLFAHRNIKVTTKHSYAIAYKYIWACTSPFCGLEYKRHSKSIDPGKHSCGSCKGKLVQTQPAPRKAKNNEGDSKGVSAYQAYVKSNSKRIRQENPGIGLGEVMKKLGEEFREMKARNAGVLRDPKLVQGEVVDVEGEEQLENDRDDDTDDVVKKLDFFHL